MAETNKLHECIEALKQCLSLVLDNIEICPLAMVEEQLSSIEQNIIPHFKQEIIQFKTETADPIELLEYQQLRMMKEIQEQKGCMNQQAQYAQQTVAMQQPAARICPACGAEVPEGEMFCGECGQKM